MKRVALVIFGRRLRTALTAFSVILGVAMVTGSFVLTDTMSKAFDSIFSSSYDKTDVVVSGRSLVDWSDQGNALVSDQLLQVQALPSVDAARRRDPRPQLQREHRAPDRPRRRDRHGQRQPDLRARSRPSQPKFNPLKLKEGRFATAPGEVVVDASSAYGSASTSASSCASPSAACPLVPARRGRAVRRRRHDRQRDDGDLRRAPGAALLSKPGYDVIMVDGRPGVSNDKLIRDIESCCPRTRRSATAAEQATADKKGVSGSSTSSGTHSSARRDRAVRRCVRHLQHALDHGRAAQRELATLRTLGRPARRCWAASCSRRSPSG